MRKLVATSLTVLITAFAAACSQTATQTGGPTATTPALPVFNAASFTSGDAFEALPPGDMLMTIDAGTLINTTIPTTLANSPEDKAKFDQELQEMQQKAGIDPKQLKLVALSVKYPAAAGGEPQFAGIMTGSFDKAKLTDALAKDSKTGAARPTEDYQGHTIYINKSDAKTEVGAVVLDDSTLVMGSPIAMVHQTIDATAKKADSAAKDADLMNAFRATKQSSLLRFASRVPPNVVPKSETEKDTMTASFAAVNMLSGSLDTATGIGLDLTAHTPTEAEAKPLYDNLQQMLEMGKKQLGGNDQMKGFASVLNATAVAMNGSNVKLTVNLTPDVVAMLAEDFKKIGMGIPGMSGGASGGMTPPPSSMNENAGGK